MDIGLPGQVGQTAPIFATLPQSCSMAALLGNGYVKRLWKKVPNVAFQQDLRILKETPMKQRENANVNINEIYCTIYA